MGLPVSPVSRTKKIPGYFLYLLAVGLFVYTGCPVGRLSQARQYNESNKKEATPRGFEPLRTKSTHLAGERLNHSAKASAKRRQACSPTQNGHRNAKTKRQQQDLNLRGQSPSDFKSDSLTTRTCCHAGRVVRPRIRKCPSGAMDSASDF